MKRSREPKPLAILEDNARLRDLKAKAYDLWVHIQQAQSALEMVNREIASLSQKPAPKPKIVEPPQDAAEA